MATLATAALLAPASASAQNASCDVYPHLCPPPNQGGNNNQNPPPGSGQQGVTVTAIQPTTNPQAASLDDGSPSTQTQGGREGNPAQRGDGGDRSGAQPARTGAGRGPIAVAPGRGGLGGPGRCWYAIVHIDTERDDIESHVKRALGQPCYVATLRRPVQLERLASLLDATSYAGVGAGDDGLDVLRRLGREVGEQLVTPESLVRLVQPVMFSEVERRIQRVSGVVVTYDRADLDDNDHKVRQVLANALVAGIRDARVPTTAGSEMPVPTVGTELTTTRPSWVPWFKARKISSVDNVDQRVGKQALAMLMSGAESGHYGVKDTAQAVLPQRSSGAQPVRYRTAAAVAEPAEAGLGAGATVVLVGSLLALVSGWAIATVTRRRIRRGLRRA